MKHYDLIAEKPSFEHLYKAASLCRQISDFEGSAYFLFSPDVIATLSQAVAEVVQVRGRLNELMLEHYPERFRTWDWDLR
jgi:hypothetical protein